MDRRKRTPTSRRFVVEIDVITPSFNVRPFDCWVIDDIIQGVVAIKRPFAFEVFNPPFVVTRKPVDSAARGSRSSLRHQTESTGENEEVSKRKAKIQSIPSQPGDVDTFAVVSKARELPGYDPSTTIQEGLAKLSNGLRQSGWDAERFREAAKVK